MALSIEESDDRSENHRTALIVLLVLLLSIAFLGILWGLDNYGKTLTAPYFYDYENLERMFKKFPDVDAGGQTAFMDTVCAAFEYFYVSQIKLDYRRLWPFEEKWQTYCQNKGSAPEPLAVAIKKGAIEKARPHDLIGLPQAFQEAIIASNYFIGNASDSTFSVKFVLERLNNVPAALDHLSRPLTVEEAGQLTGTAKIKWLVDYLQTEKSAGLTDKLCRQIFFGDVKSLADFIKIAEQQQLKFEPTFINCLADIVVMKTTKISGRPLIVPEDVPLAIKCIDDCIRNNLVKKAQTDDDFIRLVFALENLLPLDSAKIIKPGLIEYIKVIPSLEAEKKVRSREFIALFKNKS